MNENDFRESVLDFFEKGNKGYLTRKDNITSTVIQNSIMRLIEQTLTEKEESVLLDFFKKSDTEKITDIIIQNKSYKSILRYVNRTVNTQTGKLYSTNMKTVDMFAVLIKYPSNTPITPFKREHKIHEKLPNNFIGRTFLFDAVDSFIDKHDSGYFYLMGNPGIGKSAFAIKYAFERDYFLHVINAQKNGGSTLIFNNDILEQLNHVFHLDTLNPNEKINLSSALNKCASILKQPLVIVIDGIDELDDLTSYRNSNILGLPDILPKGIFILATMRNIDNDIRLPQNNGYIEKFRLEDNLPENIEDIQTYIRENTKDKKTLEYIEKNNTTRENLIKLLKEKSENNFMYLYHIIREIKEGIYTDVEMNALPQGLEGYYRDHWERMMQGVSDIDKEIKLKTLFVLGAINSLVSTKILTEILNIDLEKVKEFQIQTVINQWRQFFNISFFEDRKQYSIYHKSFLDFLASQDLVKSVGYDLSKANSLFSDYLEGDIFDDIDLPNWD